MVVAKTWTVSRESTQHLRQVGGGKLETHVAESRHFPSVAGSLSTRVGRSDAWRWRGLDGVQTVCATCTLDSDTGQSTCLCLSGAQTEEVEVEEYVVPVDTIPPVIQLKTGRDGVPFTTPTGAKIVIHTYELVRRPSPWILLPCPSLVVGTIAASERHWTLPSSYTHTHTRSHAVASSRPLASRCCLALPRCTLEPVEYNPCLGILPWPAHLNYIRPSGWL
jgi:hypothetical protein